MINCLIVTHGPLANAFKESARMFFGDEVESIDVIGLFPGDSVDDLKEKIEESIRKNCTEDGMLIFVDIYAGSPFNMTALALSDMIKDYKIECFSGINMPLLMEALACSKNMTIEELGNHIDEVSKDSIINVKNSLAL